MGGPPSQRSDEDRQNQTSDSCAHPHLVAGRIHRAFAQLEIGGHRSMVPMRPVTVPQSGQRTFDKTRPHMPICDHRHLSAAEVSGQATFQVPNRGVSEDELE